MDLNEFRSFSPLHGLCLLACGAAAAGYAVLVRHLGRDGRSVRLGRAVGIGCLAAWLANTGFFARPSRFTWSQGLPLHFCNLADLIAAAALIGASRTPRVLLYFWTFGLSIWAFLTPTVRLGPAHFEFWIFWIYHLFLVLAAAHLLVAEGFRTQEGDLRVALIWTGATASALAILDAATGWNYGFVGPSSPDAPTPIDLLGAYPGRLVWMVLGACLVFAALNLIGRSRDPTTE